MREIKFKGKRVDNGEWIKGSLIIDDSSGKYYISLSINESDKVGQDGCLYVVSCEVIPETVGQYINQKDNKGIDVYDGDILQEFYGETFIVSWLENESGFVLSDENQDNCENTFDWLGEDGECLMLEIISNIHDNSNLLE